MIPMKIRFLRLAALTIFASPFLGIQGAETTAAPAATPNITAQQAQKHLDEEWEALYTGSGTAAQENALELTVGTAPQAPEQRSLAVAATNSFDEPEEIHAEGTTLRATLVVMKAYNRIGGDPVYLRSYNGKLVGPTLRAKPGDTLLITLENRLPPEDPAEDTGHNTLHDFNVTNLHTHGLHVSPDGISDNVFLTVKPNQTQEYKIEIPRDHPCGTFWYHAHYHGSTAAQVASGMAGALIIEGGIDNVPEISKARDRLFVLQQIAYIYKNCFPDPTPQDPSHKVCYTLPFGVIEQEYEDRIFGPRSWNALGRYTTVNGVQLPVIRVRPGSVERWRFVDSGMRERIELKLESAAPPAGQPASVVPLHVIAEDGLPLGMVDSRSIVELWPGYRADALMKAPDTPGEYLLVDEATPASLSLEGVAENRKYIARVIVEGDPEPMALPSDAELAGFRLPSIPPGKPGEYGQQSAIYGIIKNPTGEGILFTVNGKAYDEENVRELKLGGTDEWTIESINDVGAVSHPFHIHVNPFEVYSMVDDKGVEQLKFPIWRDTIILHERWIIKARTHYADFAGSFVQHCHILDHEDQGMMEKVQIVDPAHPMVRPPPAPTPPYTAPSFSLADPAGRITGLSDYAGKPVVLFFFEGEGCLHCTEQVALFNEQAKAFADKGVSLLAVTSDTSEVLRKALAANPSPFPILADPQLDIFRLYHCVGSEALHGTFLIDAAGQVRWQNIGSNPFTGIGLLLLEAGKLPPPTPKALSGQVVPPVAAPAAAPSIEIQIRDSSTGEYDYVAWSPTAARIRQVPGSAPADLAVVLTNAPAQPIPSGRDLPLEGNVVFAPAPVPGRAPDQSQLAVTLPGDGSWVPFVIAGKFPQASSQDKDTVIEVHRGTPDGPVVGTHALMVRVRKDIRKLTVHERTRFLQALDDLNRQDIGPDGMSRYMYFVHLHQAAAVGLDFPDHGVDYYWPDLAHKGPGFIAWHRAFLLEFEREIQKKFPDVALPYWVMTEDSPIFTEDFMGANDIKTGGKPMPARFSPDNPLYGWTADIDGAHDEPVQRFAVDRVPGNPGVPKFATDSTLFQLTTYSKYPGPGRGGFVDAMESNPHNNGHNWVGPWMQNCQTSPRDPIFWVFHTGLDRQWAHWQYLQNRFDPAGAGGSYFPLGSFENPNPKPAPGDCDNVLEANSCVPITHRIDDNLWPWSEKFGQGTTKKGSLPQASFAQPVLHPFPAAPVAGLWPAADAHPTPGDMIDYLGINPGRLPMGFGYDDSPYGAAAAPRAGSLVAAAAPAEPAADLSVASNVSGDPSMRAAALRSAEENDDPHWVDAALAVVADRDHGSAQLTADALSLLSEAMMLTAQGSGRESDIIKAMDGALADPREIVRLAALWPLVDMGHGGVAVAALTQALQSPEGASFEPGDAIRGLSLAGQAIVDAPLIRPYLAAEDPAVRITAISALGSDPGSAPIIRQILADRGQATAFRLAALRALGPKDAEALRIDLNVAADAGEPTRLRAEAIATLGIASRSVRNPPSADLLEDINARLGNLSAADSERIGSVVSETVLDATRQLNLIRNK
jgi:FtsP/CotA-like multicopper oxidase with cupredoxin domain/peroxiredoxin